MEMTPFERGDIINVYLNSYTNKVFRYLNCEFIKANSVGVFVRVDRTLIHFFPFSSISEIIEYVNA